MMYFRVHCSTSRKAGVSTNRPIMAGMDEMPPSSTVKPKVLRIMPVAGSMPMIEQSRPSRQAIRPLLGVLPDRLITVVKPKMITATYSTGPKATAMRAKKGASRISASQPIMQPTRLLVMPTPRALPASPFWARGKPSNVVAMEAGVPGMPSRMAVTRPPEMPPIYTPISMAMAIRASMP